MAEIEKHNPQLAGVLPRTYQIFTSTLLKELLKKVSEIPVSLDYDAFGRIYEYFLGEFARTEGSKGGEFYTPSSIVRLLVEVIEPFHGRILDPACGSGGMFVQSARFVAEHQKNAADELFIHGVEKTDDTGRLARMNLAIHGLEGDIRHGGHINSYYDDPHEAVGKFDFVLANPPFNVNAVDKDRLAAEVGAGRRFPFGLPRSDNANMLWIQLFYSSLNDQGRAGFVMANSASDARSSEQEIRKQLIEARAVDVMVAVGPSMFYTVTLPCTLWFLDKGKHGTPRAETILFIDARHIYRQIDRAHRDWADTQIGFIANVVRLYRGEEPDYTLGGEEAKAKLVEVFGKKPSYADIAGLCKAASLVEQPAIQLFAELGWETLSASDEVIGANGTLGRETKSEVVLTGRLDEKFKDPNDPLRLVFVCAMWLTGFDAPSCSTIYLDKPIRNHSLMQTIARANRVRNLLQEMAKEKTIVSSGHGVGAIWALVPPAE